MSTEVLSISEYPAPAACHHCGAPLGPESSRIVVSGQEVRVCGNPCRTAVATIANAGLDAWYGLRAHSDAQGAATADPRHRAELDTWRVPEVEASLLRRGGDDDLHVGTGHGRPGDDTGAGTGAVTLTVEDMRCAGCAWLVERLLASVPGVAAATVDFPLRRAEVRFDTRTTRLHTLLETLAKAGYRATPYSVHAEEAAIESERRERIRGLGISALFGMQVMLLSIALYASDWYGGMNAGLEQLFRWLAMMLTVPVLAWPGRTFFTGAVAALRSRRLTMDVPVALGLSIAFAGSAFATVTGEGEVWFDSVVMFVTLLSAARYLELLARRRATAAIRALARSAPLVATRVRAEGANGDTAPAEADLCAAQGNVDGGGVHPGNEGEKTLDTPCAAGAAKTGRDAASHGSDGSDGIDRADPGTERIPAAALRPGDRVRVRPGEVVPADGTIRSGHSAFDESLLTGESNPVARSADDQVLAGSVNGSGVVEVEVACVGDETVLGGVLRRAEQAARERPAIAELADRAAAWFIGGVLVLAAGVAIGWLLHEPARMIPVLVSVLVVTCPCALSLATPAAMTAALGALARVGLIATRANAVERLALATHCLADKTGTLTEGRFRLRAVETFTDVSESQCLALAAALERYATHPAASALVAAASGARDEEPSIGDADAARGGGETSGIGAVDAAKAPSDEHAIGHTIAAETVAPQVDRATLEVQEPRTHTGGVTGRVDGAHYAVGSPEFVVRACGLDPGTPGNDDGATYVFLARDGTPLARFTLADTLRADAGTLVDGLRRRGIETTIASGDSAAAVEHAARDLGVTRHLSGLSPEDKLEEVARLAASGERVLMLGDGVNDTPALAGAHVSVAMGRGAAAAAARADAVLVGDDPDRLLAALDIARFARRIVKQNLAWALGYNLVALPLAAAGMVPPWAAAIGMSLSSLAVAGNALRIGRGRGTTGD
ncbi:MAG: cation-translocating P-type ATPase [Gammaproteobacteria bacterium]|nr:cation-translocating P-type ATPase [Gammaproteobacteria bacterium]